MSGADGAGDAAPAGSDAGPDAAPRVPNPSDGTTVAHPGSQRLPHADQQLDSGRVGMERQQAADAGYESSSSSSSEGPALRKRSASHAIHETASGAGADDHGAAADAYAAAPTSGLPPAEAGVGSASLTGGSTADGGAAGAADAPPPANGGTLGSTVPEPPRAGPGFAPGVMSELERAEREGGKLFIGGLNWDTTEGSAAVACPMRRARSGRR